MRGWLTTTPTFTDAICCVLATKIVELFAASSSKGVTLVLLKSTGTLPAAVPLNVASTKTFVAA
jgi:hypothetical protein